MFRDWIGRYEKMRFGVRNFIDGRSEQGCGARITKESPRDGRVLFELCSGDARQVDRAVASARRAFEDGRWSKVPVHGRQEALRRLASLIEEHSEELALLECIDVGRPINDVLAFDIPEAAACLRNNAEMADKILGRVYGSDSSGLSYQLRRPIGVVGAIVGWNFPLLLAAVKIGPALATGNCVVLKPSELTALTTTRIAELAMEAGIPQGVLNVIHGDSDVGSALGHHPDVDLITFTGSSQTGKRLLVAAGESNMKRLILECGGKSPNIVFDDSPNLTDVAKAIVAKAFWNQGQVCTASSRLLVQDTAKDKLLPLIVTEAAAMSLGDPLDPATRFGPLVSRNQRGKVLDYVGLGKQEGAAVAFESGSTGPFADGFYVPPIVFDGVSPNQRIAREEIFGPVLSVLSFHDEEEAIRIANGTTYGLSAILWTTDLGRAHRASQGIRAGSIVVNATAKPIGDVGGSAISIGGHKESGLGVEGGIEGMEAYTSQSAVQWLV